jgi:hypothetical protein
MKELLHWLGSALTTQTAEAFIGGLPATLGGRGLAHTRSNPLIAIEFRFIEPVGAVGVLFTACRRSGANTSTA